MTRQHYHRWTIAVMFVVLFTIGCRDSVVNDLQGRWIGKPDTAAALGFREAERYQGPSRAATQHTAHNAQHAVTSANSTDWERYDVRVLLNFIDDERLEMSLADCKQSLSGRWRVAQSSVAGVLIEVETKTMVASGESTETGESEWRRFDLQLDYDDGQCVGFRLNESGTDPQLGSIYFQRGE